MNSPIVSIYVIFIYDEFNWDIKDSQERAIVKIDE